MTILGPEWPTDQRPNPTGVYQPRPPGIGLPILGVYPVTDTPDAMVQFQPVEGDQPNVTAWLRSESWAVNAGDSAISRVEIPRRTARTVWQGRDPITMQGEILLTGGPTKVSVEAACRALDGMMGRGRRGTPSEPTSLIVNANGAIPYDAKWQPDLRWWIEGIDWGTAPGDVYRRGDWHRWWQIATVQLVQVVRGDLNLRASSAQAARDRLRRDARLTTVVKSGETLRGVAKRIYGDTGRWEDIARLNKLSSPKVRAGRTLRLP